MHLLLATFLAFSAFFGFVPMLWVRLVLEQSQTRLLLGLCWLTSA